MEDEDIEILRERIKRFKNYGVKFIVNRTKLSPNPYQTEPRTAEQRRLKIVEICPFHTINDINRMIDDVEQTVINNQVITKIEDLCDETIVES